MPETAGIPHSENKTACRGCGAASLASVLDLGTSPLANAYRTQAQAREPEYFHPLHAVLCGRCLLMQLESVPPPEAMFGGYLYFSSYSATMLAHAEAFAREAMERFGLSKDSLVVEVASNDGYLLKHFAAAGIPVLGIEPAETVAQAARKNHGIETLTRYFNRQLAGELRAAGKKADLIVANNVLAHVPDINDFIAGFEALLSDKGVVSVEFPDVANLLAEGQFDTIYHEHCFYLSLHAVERLFRQNGLTVFDAQPQKVHGGSLRVLACREGAHPVSLNVARLRDAALEKPETYLALKQKAHEIKRGLLEFLIHAKREGKRVAAYGAPAKGNTLLNFCGIRTDMIDFTVDASPHKQGLFLPGSGIPVLAPQALDEYRPDYILILPWNLREEIVSAHARIANWGGRFVLAIPKLKVL